MPLFYILNKISINMKTTYTREEVEQILVSMFVYSSANFNQGLLSVDGRNFGEQATTVIEAYESIIDTNKSILAMLSLLKKGTSN